MQFAIVGADLKSGEDRTVIVSADTASEAERIAAQGGLAVASVLAVGPAAPRRVGHWTIARGVVIGTVACSLLALCVSVFFFGLRRIGISLQPDPEMLDRQNDYFATGMALTVISVAVVGIVCWVLCSLDD